MPRRGVERHLWRGGATLVFGRRESATARTQLPGARVALEPGMRSTALGLVLVMAALAPRVARADAASARNAVTRAVIDGDYAYALKLATGAAMRWPKAAWPEYERGVALKHLGRTDEAVRAFARVEDNPSAGAFKAIAIFGRARTLDDAGRCPEARIAYDEYAAWVRPTSADAAEIATEDAHECYERANPDPVPTIVASALMSGDYAKVLELTRAAVASERGRPWLDYDRASALTAVGRIDDAVESFRRAEMEFGQRRRWEQSLAIWGAARAFESGARCGEATREYRRYAELMRPYDAAAADMAERFGRACAPIQ